MLVADAMSDAALRIDTESLLAQAGWVRELALRLASGAEADELEQATWLAALRARVRPATPLREWLGTVARNAALERRRAAGRRAQREARAARPEALPDTAELVERADLQRRLVGAVVALEEPYRSTVLLRYFEHLPPRAIAARLGVPVATVRTRLARALARLREDLEAEHGGRTQWLAALAPLTSTLDTSHAGWGAVLLMNAKIVLSVATLGAAGALAWLIADSRPTPVRGAVASTPVEVPGPAPRQSPPADEPDVVEVQRVAAGQGIPADEAPQAAVAASPAGYGGLSGRVFDERGRGLADVPVVARDAGAGGAEAQSGPGGEFAIEEGPERGTIESGASELVTVYDAPFDAQTREGLHLVVAPRLSLAGQALDEGGAPVEGARVSLQLPENYRARFDVVLDRAQPRTWSATCDATGRFALEDLPRIEGALLNARADGFLAWSEPAPTHSDLALRLVLQRPREAAGVVRGTVLDSSGAPLAGALVAFGLDTQRSGPDGSFAFELVNPGSFSARFGQVPDSLRAVAPGWLPAEFEPKVVDGAPRWPEHVTLRLESPALSIGGRVIDSDGEPVEGVCVYVADATLFGAVDGRPALLETLFTPGEGLWRFVQSDADGRFTVEGLLDRDYVVRAHHSPTLLRADSEPTRAGTRGLELRLPTDRLFPLVAGRILTLGGEPVAGATVRPMCDALRLRHEGRTFSTSHDATAETTTDADGRFELRDVPMSLVYLRVDGEGILPEEYGRYAADEPRFADVQVKELPVERITNLEIRVASRCHLQVELSRPDLADELAVLDAEGRELPLSLYSGTSRRDGPRQPIHDGRSAVLSVPESGVTLVLYRADVEVDRSPLQLDPSAPTHVLR